MIAHKEFWVHKAQIKDYGYVTYVCECKHDAIEEIVNMLERKERYNGHIKILSIESWASFVRSSSVILYYSAHLRAEKLIDVDYCTPRRPESDIASWKTAYIN